MRIWFDISNSPHINMFYDMICSLERDGHLIIITSRPLANTIALLDSKGLKHKPVGIHYGKNLLGKLFGFPVRVYQLWKYLQYKQVDLAVSQSSFHSPLTAKLLGVPSIYTNDNEHAIGNLPSFLFATTILLPESFRLNQFSQKSFIRNKIQFYPGIKEGIYLWRLSEKINARPPKKNPHLLNLYIRPEPSTAQYYNGKENFLDDLIKQVSSDYNITILPRNASQVSHYTGSTFKRVHVATKPIAFEEIAADCDLFVGAGGSMTRELAMVGIPTLSVYQDVLLEVDKVLIESNLMRHVSNVSQEDLARVSRTMTKAIQGNALMEKGKHAYDIFYQLITNCKKIPA